MPRAKPVEETRSGKCKCNPAFMVVAWILGALGLWALVGGFTTQFGMNTAATTFNVNVLGWYFAGLLLVGLAKMSKWKACGCCGVHKM